MWTLVSIYLVFVFIGLLIWFWIWFVNRLFRSSSMKTVNDAYFIKTKMNESVIQNGNPDHVGNSEIELSDRNSLYDSQSLTSNGDSEIEPSGIVKASVLCDGVYKKENLPKIYQDSWVYFQEYLKKDGAWVEEDELVCKLRIGEYKESYEAVILKTSKSGFLEHTTKSPMLFEEDIIFRINEKGNITDPNLIGDERYEHYYNTIICRFGEWLVDDGAFVKANTQVYRYFDSSSNTTQNHKAEIDGFLDIQETPDFLSASATIFLYLIQKDDSIRVSRKFKNKHKITVDEFQGSKIIQWESVSTGEKWSSYEKRYHEGIGSKSDDHKVGLLFSFNYINGRDHIVFHFSPKELNIQVNDVVEFLFENNRQIRFEINSKPISTKNNADERVSECFSVITKQELELFANVNLKKWKITFENGMKEILGGDIGGIENYRSKHNLQIVTKKFAQDYISLVNQEIEDYTPIEDKEMINEAVRQNEACYVYLMKDLSNGFYKIGISNNPEYRERTLQSEKPSIEMITSKKFPVRKIAESFEKSLHAAYANKRIRGEWFDLTSEDADNIIISLK